MRRILALAAAAAMGVALAEGAAAAGQNQSAVVAAEISTIAKHLQMRPETAIDFSDVSGEYCFNAGLGRGGHMTHYAIEPETRTEDVIDFVNATPLIDAGIPVDDLPAFPGELESMQPNRWYFVAAGTYEPHHGRKFPFPLMIRASSLE